MLRLSKSLNGPGFRPSCCEAMYRHRGRDATNKTERTSHQVTKARRFQPCRRTGIFSSCLGGFAATVIFSTAIQAGPHQKEKSRPDFCPDGIFCYSFFGSLDHGYVRCLKAFGALLDIKFDGIAFIQALVTIALDRLEVDEYIFATGA